MLPATRHSFPPLPQPKLVLDLATPEGCKAELTWVVVISQDSYPRNTVTYLRNDQAGSWPGFNLRPRVTRPTSLPLHHRATQRRRFCYYVSDSESCCITSGPTGEAGYTGATGATGPAKAVQHTGPPSPCDGPIGE